MADNITIKDGSNADVTIATEDRGGVHYQLALVASSVLKQATYTRPADTTAYAAGDVLSDSTSAGTYLTFSGVATTNGGGAEVVGVTIVDDANQTTKLQVQLWLFDTAPGATLNDNAALALSDTDMSHLVAIIPVSNVYVGNTASGASGNCALVTAGQVYKVACASGDTALYGVLVVQNAYTPVSGESLTVKLHLAQG